VKIKEGEKKEGEIHIWVKKERGQKARDLVDIVNLSPDLYAMSAVHSMSSSLVPLEDSLPSTEGSGSESPPPQESEGVLTLAPLPLLLLLLLVPPLADELVFL
jgi:hypothetical protein